MSDDPIGTPHSTTLRVRFYELDPYGHVNHSVYVQYFETARIELLTSIGQGLDTLLAADTQLVVVNLATRFVRPAGLDDQLTVETGLVEHGRATSRWAQRIALADQIIATQVVEFAATDRNGRARRLPVGLREGAEIYRVDPDWLGSHRPRLRSQRGDQQ